MPVSIVVPYFNASQTITTCTDAIKEQMDPDDELIIVNDGSAKKHLGVLKRLTGYKKVHHLENLGAAKARNSGLQKAVNEQVVFVDADVLLKEGCLDRIRGVLKDEADACFIIPSQERQEGFFSDYKNLYMASVLLTNDADESNYIYGSCCAVGKHFLKTPWPEELRLIEDNVWGHKLWKLGAKIKKIKDKNFIHLKEYTALSLIKNDYLVSCQFARFMWQHKRWETLYRSSKFGHTSKGQKAAVILAFFALPTSFLLPEIGLMFALCWMGLNIRMFKFFYKRRGLFFTLFSIFWTYISHLVYFSGILSGFFLELLSTLNGRRNRIEQD